MSTCVNGDGRGVYVDGLCWPCFRKTMPGRRVPLVERIEEGWTATPTGLPLAGWLGVDVGYVYPAVDSDGEIYRWGQSVRESLASPEWAHAPAGPVRIRRADGTVREQPAYGAEELKTIYTRARTEGYSRRLWLLASKPVGKARDSDRGLVLEDLRSIRRRRAYWVEVWSAIVAYAKLEGVAVSFINPAGTSTTCPSCGHRAKQNRPERNRFRCVACGHQGQADRVAAVNILSLADRGVVEPGICGNPPCETPSWKAGLCCSCYFWRRRRGVLPDADQIDRLAIARDWREFYALLDREQVGSGA